MTDRPWLALPGQEKQLSSRLQIRLYAGEVQTHLEGFGVIEFRSEVAEDRLLVSLLLDQAQVQFNR